MRKTVLALLLLVPMVETLPVGSSFTPSLAVSPCFAQASAQRTLPPQQSYISGLAFYKAGHYREAAQLFWKSITDEGGGPSSWLYMAHSYYACGERDKAIQTYRTVRDVLKSPQEAAIASQYLARLDPRNEWKAKDGTMATAAPKIPGSIKKRIEIVRPRIGHPNVSADTTEAIDEAIDKIPPRILKILNDARVSICITPTMIDKFPEGAYQEVAGYEGGTDKSCPGMFSDGVIYIAQHTVDERTDEVKGAFSRADIEETFLHEAGHAVDYALGRISHTSEYEHAYLLDIAHVPDDVAHRIRYYLQKSLRGQREACAEVLANLMGMHNETSEDVKSVFKNTIVVLKKRIGL
ncbi:MAG: hypothetical protein K2Y32_09110 [Candidatus Obscuribacterales bacterium]|nr:hypothetical protein [Candidatus Obscuribacterales bacterium]